ncbi:WhiB family transcriptional regulator [Rhodococcus aetherivorans]
MTTTRPVPWHGRLTVLSPDNIRGPARARLEKLAKDVCRRCPVLAACRDHALCTRELHGIWGGMTARERALWCCDTAS